MTDISNNSNISTSSGGTIGNDVSSIFATIFNKSNFVLILWFLAIYVIASFLIGIFRKTDQDTSPVARFVDIFVFAILLVLIFYYFLSYSDNEKQASLNDLSGWFEGFLSDNTSIITIFFSILFLYTVIYITQIPMGINNKPVIVGFLEWILWGLFMILLIIESVLYLFHISLVDVLFHNKLFSTIWNKLPNQAPETVDVCGNIINASGGIMNVSGGIMNVSGGIMIPKNEVFNISNNLYTYDDAQAICSVYGAQLATYDQVEEAYKDGAEWCNYGWSENQMAFFPTQKSTWQKLQSVKGHENDCGRPGINGGFISNPYIQFGVNCYGKKPEPTEEELAALEAAKTQTYPASAEDIATKAKLAYWFENSGQLLQMNSFNRKTWSEYTK